MMSLKRSATRLRRGLLPAIVLALFLVLAQRPGPAAALGGAPPGPPQILSAGTYHTCGLTVSGSVDCWGYDATGQATDQPGPYVQVSGGNLHTCALTPTGAADCWGSNGAGQAADQPGPYLQISTGGGYHTCALKPTGAVDCWGFNGNGEATDKPGPYLQVSAGQNHTCALTALGAADCWGFNGEGRATDQPGPYIQIGAGARHTCALTPTGAADCWGDNAGGQADDQPGPFVEISVGQYHNCGLTPNGAADCWGFNDSGVADDQIGPYTQLSGGSGHTCGLTPTGAADCWGDNTYGQADDQPDGYRPYEPNETDNVWNFGQELTVGRPSVNNFIGVAGDRDYFYFFGDQGEQMIIEAGARTNGSDMDPLLTLYYPDGSTVLAENDDYNGNRDSRIELNLPYTGIYYLRVRDYNHPNVGGPRHFYNLSLRPISLYVSSTASGTTGGVAATPQDIIAYDPTDNTWSMLFDGSDVGVTKALTAFARLHGGDWLLVFKANQPTPAGTFTPWDVARFSPTSLGSTTAGTFSWYFDGSDVGLTTSGEKIDALDVDTGGNLYISVGGGLAVPKPGGGTLKAQDEDLVGFSPATKGATTAGEWYAWFDGTVVPGLKGEDINAAHYDPETSDFYVGITGAFKVGGVSGNGKDVLLLTPAAVPGGYTVLKFIPGPDIGFNLLLSGLEID